MCRTDKRRKATFKTRFNVYIKAPRECFTEYRPIDHKDKFDKEKFSKLIEVELADPNIISYRLFCRLANISVHYIDVNGK